MTKWPTIIPIIPPAIAPTSAAIGAAKRNIHPASMSVIAIPSNITGNKTAPITAPIKLPITESAQPLSILLTDNSFWGYIKLIYPF